MMKEHVGSILIVEDDPELTFLLGSHLGASGFRVFEAKDGLQAVAMARDLLPDVVLLDVGLPVMDGITVTRALKSAPETKHIPVIMLTGRTASSDVVRGFEAGAQEYLSKPFEIAELLARVRTVHRLAMARRDVERLNSRLEHEIESKTRTLQLLYEFMRDLNHAAARDSVYDLVVRAVEQLTGARRISLLMAQLQNRELKCVRAVGIPEEVAEGIRVDPSTGIAGQVYRTGKMISARASGGHGTNPTDYVREAFVIAPLFSTSLTTQDGVIGVLNVTEKPDDAVFSDEEIECIRSIADTAAIALDGIVRREQLQQSVGVLLQTVGLLAEYRDEETTQHLQRVSRMADILAREVRQSGPYATQVTDEFLRDLVQAAPLHDIGKVGIPDDILTKPGKLTDEEYQIMKTHTDIGWRVLSRAYDPANPNRLLKMCIDIAHCHHERFDGTGYPRRLRGADIPLAARIIALVDAYDAITSRRRYSQPRTHEQAMEVIRGESSRHFDPILVSAFLRCHERFDDIRARYEENREGAVVEAGSSAY